MHPLRRLRGLDDHYDGRRGLNLKQLRLVELERRHGLYAWRGDRGHGVLVRTSGGLRGADLPAGRFRLRALPRAVHRMPCGLVEQFVIVFLQLILFGQ